MQSFDLRENIDRNAIIFKEIALLLTKSSSPFDISISISFSIRMSKKKKKKISRVRQDYKNVLIKKAKIIHSQCNKS